MTEPTASIHNAPTARHRGLLRALAGAFGETAQWMPPGANAPLFPERNGADRPSFWSRISAQIGIPSFNPFAPLGGNARPPSLEAGAARQRLATFRPASEHINSLLHQSGNTVVARARYITRNNGYARAALRSWSTATVGAGIKVSSSIKDNPLREAVMRAYADWTDEADAENLTDLYGLQRRVAREAFVAGEVFIRFIRQPAEDGASVPLQLQVLPSEQCPTWKNETAPNGNTIRMGIEFDGRGRRVAYHFWKENPTDAAASFASAVEANALIRVPADDVCHVFDPEEAGQIRGLSGYAAAIVNIFQHDLYCDAELERKKQAARFATFIERGAPEPGIDDIADDDPANIIPKGPDGLPFYGPGATVVLADGETARFSEPADVGPNFESFQYRVILQICAALGVPYSEISYDLNRTSYASSRADLVAYRAAVEQFQYSTMIFQFVRRVYTEWLATAVLSGAVPIGVARWNRERRSLQRFEAITPHQHWVDPLRDRSAEEIAVRCGWKSRSMVIESEGYDVEEVNQRIAADRRREAELGLDFDIPVKGAATMSAASDNSTSDDAPGRSAGNVTNGPWPTT